ncbi:hypothetical protein A2U01_0071177, partial [Trifolium medium]|nr:hypothetical protein [Trifolium medium]
ILAKGYDFKVPVWNRAVDLFSPWFLVLQLLFLALFFVSRASRSTGFGDLTSLTVGAGCSAFFFFGVVTVLRFFVVASKHLLAAAMSPLIVATCPLFV